MPLKLNVGLSRKVGEPNFGSRGASVNLELELESAVVNDPERLRERIRWLFGLAKTSINEELSGGHNGQDESSGRDSDASAHPPVPSGGNGAVRPATQSQVRAIHAIARRQQVDLPHLLRERFHVDRPDDLTLRDASVLIDDLQTQQADAGR